jgi:hypothetical protein
VRTFKKEHNRSPNDSDTQAIALELADFNAADQKYITMKLKLVLEDQLPFQVDEFITKDSGADQSVSYLGAD